MGSVRIPTPVNVNRSVSPGSPSTYRVPPRVNGLAAFWVEKATMDAMAIFGA